MSIEELGWLIDLLDLFCRLSRPLHASGMREDNLCALDGKGFKPKQ